jgi:acyl-CoA reductase-like NAD-dependent aldehyde dehydrogenase
MPVQTTISPIDNKPCTELDLLSADGLDSAIAASVAAQKAWRRTTLKERIDICQCFLVGRPACVEAEEGWRAS